MTNKKTKQYGKYTERYDLNPELITDKTECGSVTKILVSKVKEER